MNVLKTVLAIAALLLVTSCTIESDTVLPDPTAAGDAIPGFPSDKPFRLETFEKDKQVYKAFATITPERETEALRYVVTFDDGTPNRLVVQARKISENNYLIRFAQTIEGLRPSLSESGLGFVTIRDGDYYLLSGITDDGQLEEMFPGQTLPRGAGTSTIKLDTMDQAKTISAWFGANFQKLTEYKDYTKFRVVKEQN
ncbi:hypothetical protein IHQ71_09140 [Rhizobium sp. TH2]|uniref:hypothetical protein n=1 Tax=Rhizobium sp. TH2 TaxID=2775403 RepID=UPI0021587C83|nr:hypothetical protein [Rhizobium sp. TH2]UVC10723.1 hypothetical protein IHQ71_09140 [Rhizobium sp. TH2]